MNKHWETFEGQQYRTTARKEPRVTLGYKRTFYLNGIAYEAMGEPAAGEMLFDGTINNEPNNSGVKRDQYPAPLHHLHLRCACKQIPRDVGNGNCSHQKPRDQQRIY